jgi:O-antigen/teichoic acid export membrane protein
MRDFIADTDQRERRGATIVLTVVTLALAAVGGAYAGAIGALVGVAATLGIVALVFITVIVPCVYLDWLWWNVPIGRDGRHQLRHRR